MTRDEALAEAQRRWGPGSRISDDDFPNTYVLWRRLDSFRLVTVGIGDSWEDAFLDADRRAK